MFGTDNWEVVDVDEEWVSYVVLIKKEKKSSNYNYWKISKLLNDGYRCVNITKNRLKELSSRWFNQTEPAGLKVEVSRRHSLVY